MLLAAFFYALMQGFAAYCPNAWLQLGFNEVCVVLFAAHSVYHDLPLRQLPVVGRYFKK